MKTTRLLTLAVPAVALLAFAADPALAAEAAEGAGGDDGSLFASPGFKEVATSLIALLIFLGLLAVLAKFAWGPIVKSLEGRENRIRSDIEAAEKARAESERAMAEHKRQLDEADARVRDIIAQANADGQQLATRIRMQAQEEIEEKREKADRDIEQSRREAVESVRAEAANLAVAIAEKILGREVNVDDQQRLIEESLDEMKRSGVNGEAVTA